MEQSGQHKTHDQTNDQQKRRTVEQHGESRNNDPSLTGFVLGRQNDHDEQVLHDQETLCDAAMQGIPLTLARK